MDRFKYYLVDVKSNVMANGKLVAFDYMNTFYDPEKAIAEAKQLRKNPDVISVGVFEWYREGNNKDNCSDDNCLYSFNANSKKR